MKIKETGYNKRFIVNVSSLYEDKAKKIIDDLNKLKENKTIDSVSDEILGMIFDVWVRRKERGYYNMNQSKISDFTYKQKSLEETEDYGLEFFSPIPRLGEFYKKGIGGEKLIRKLVYRIQKGDRTISLSDLAKAYYDAEWISRQVRSHPQIEELLEEELVKLGFQRSRKYHL